MEKNFVENTWRPLYFQTELGSAALTASHVAVISHTGKSGLNKTSL